MPCWNAVFLFFSRWHHVYHIASSNIWRLLSNTGVVLLSVFGCDILVLIATLSILLHSSKERKEMFYYRYLDIESRESLSNCCLVCGGVGKTHDSAWRQGKCVSIATHSSKLLYLYIYRAISLYRYVFLVCGRIFWLVMFDSVFLQQESIYIPPRSVISFLWFKKKKKDIIIYYVKDWLLLYIQPAWCLYISSALQVGKYM